MRASRSFVRHRDPSGFGVCVVLALATATANAQVADGAAPTSESASFPAESDRKEALPAQPISQEREARERYDRGLSLYAEGEFALAVVEFERAYELVPDFRTLFNIGQVRLQLGQYAKAHNVLSSYLADAGSQISAERRAQVLADLEMLATRTALLRFETNVTGAEVSLDEVVLGAAPLPDAFRVDAGEHLVVMRARGYQPKRVRVTLASQESKTVAIRLDRIEVLAERVIVERSQPAPAATADTSGWRTGLWIGAGSLAIASVVTAVLGSSAASDLKQKRSQLGVSRDELDSASRRAHALLIAADVSGAVALLAGGGALYLTLTADPVAAESAESDQSSKRRNDTPAEATLRLGAGWIGVAGSY